MPTHTEMNIPSTSTCYQLMHRMGMLSHIIEHSRQVCRVALCVADHLSTADANLNPELVAAAALLHDITKTRSFETGEDHALTGCRYLCALGYPEVGEVVGQHVRLESDDGRGRTAEARIVNYADKRVLHDRIVSLDRRMAYILHKYGTEPQKRKRIQRLWAGSKKLEKTLFSQLPFGPHDLVRHLSHGQSACDGAVVLPADKRFPV